MTERVGAREGGGHSESDGADRLTANREEEGES